jgi:ABC-type Na+ efflux pump permease subunit
MNFSSLNVWPVLQRELREGARKPVNHRLRCLSCGVGMVLPWVILARPHRGYMTTVLFGSWLFGIFHSMLLALILIVVPALAADGIAREKREGTLGLLFLTPLSAGGIVVGKTLAQGLRTFNLWLAVVPLLTIPFLTGGVTWFDAFSALSLEFCVTVLCLGAGLLASTLARGRNAAFALALVLGVAFWFVFMQLDVFALLVSWRGWGFLKESGWQPLLSLETLTIFCGLLDIRGGAGWSAFATVSPRLMQIWGLLCVISPLVTLVVFYGIARFAARRVERSWQDKLPSPRREGLVRRYCTPVFRRRFEREMRQTLDWNPIAWLQQYSWKARLSKWGLCLGFVLILWAVDNGNRDVRGTVELVLLLVLAGVYTFMGVSGFLEEKRSGALELLLITPISVNKLIFGRVWGLWKQFIPSGLALVICYAYLQLDDYTGGGNWYKDAQSEAILASGFFTLPVIATYFALRVKNLFVGAALTWVTLCLPIATDVELYLPRSLTYFLDPSDLGIGAGMVLASYIGFAFVACFLLKHSLSRRIYAF